MAKYAICRLRYQGQNCANISNDSAESRRPCLSTLHVTALVGRSVRPSVLTLQLAVGLLEAMMSRIRSYFTSFLIHISSFHFWMDYNHYPRMKDDGYLRAEPMEHAMSLQGTMPVHGAVPAQRPSYTVSASYTASNMVCVRIPCRACVRECARVRNHVRVRCPWKKNVPM